MQWKDQGIVIGKRRLGEKQSIGYIYTHNHGRHSGIITETSTKRLLEGALVTVEWKARLEEHIGNWILHEETSLYLAGILGRSDSTQGLSVLCLGLHLLMPERLACTKLFEEACKLLVCLSYGKFLEAYTRFEALLLWELGYGNITLENFLSDQLRVSTRQEFGAFLDMTEQLFEKYFPTSTPFLDARKKMLIRIMPAPHTHLSH